MIEGAINVNLTDLQAKQMELLEQINDIRQGNKIGDLQALNDELNLVSNQISDIEYANKQAEAQQQIAQEHTALVEETKAQTAYLLDTLEIEGLSISQLSASAEAYEILREGLQLFIDQREESALDKLKQAKEESTAAINELKLEVEQLTKENANQSQAITQLKVELLQAGDTINELEDKHRAATSQLEESQTEVARLNSQVDDLRAEIAVGARAAQQVANASEDLKAKAEAFKKSIQDSIIPIVNKRWDEEAEVKHSYYLAERADTMETVRFMWTAQSKYKEVTEADAATFRIDYLAKQAAEVETTSPGVLEVAEQHLAPQPEEAPAATEPGLDQTNAGVEVAGETVTREEFEGLKSEVEYIKDQLYKNGINL